MKQRMKGIWVAALLLGIMLTGCGGGYSAMAVPVDNNPQAAANEIMTDSMALSGAGLYIQLDYGLNGHVKYNRYMKISAEITNNGNDFSGWLQMILPVDDENSMYRKELQVKAGKKEKLFMAFPACMNQNQILFSVNRQNGEEVCSKTFSLNLTYGTSEAYIGVYSDKQEGLGYLEGMNSKVLYLTKEDFTADYKALDVLDVIVISDKDVRDFTKRQIRGVASWVRRGGTLVLADSGSHRELKPFSTKMGSWKVGRTRQVSTCFGLDFTDTALIEQRLVQKLEAEKTERVKEFLRENLSAELYNSWGYEIANIQDNSYCLEESGEIFTYLKEFYRDEKIKASLSLSVTNEERERISENIQIPVIHRKLTNIRLKESETLVATEQEKVLLQKTTLGLGNVILSGCSLVMAEKYWNVLGNEIAEKILDNLSSKRKKQLLLEQQQNYDTGNYIYRRGLLVTETDSLPNLKLYGAILAVYVILIGPVLFFLFWRRGKSVFLWGTIPAAAVLFSVFIYLIGTRTRIQSPYVNYLSHMQLEGNGQAVLRTWFRPASGKNDSYEIELKGNCDVEPLIANQGYQVLSDSEKNKSFLNGGYQYGIEYGNNVTKIAMEELSAFEGKDFKDEEVIPAGGDIEMEITSSGMSLQGTVSNGFSYGLEDCFLFDNGTVYYLGDIGAGKRVSLKDTQSDDIYRQNDYNYDYDELAARLFGSSYWSPSGETDCEMQRRAVLAEGYLEESANSDTFFLGFAAADNSPENMFMDKFSYEKNGAMCISKHVDIKYTSNGMELFPDISKYAVSYDSSVTDGKMIKDFSQNRIQVSYRLPAGYQWKGLTYNQNNNAEFSYYNNGYLSSAIFDGLVTMIDRKTGQEIGIIESGRETNLELNPGDMGSDGVLTLNYYLNTSTGHELQLPNIMVSVTKNQNGAAAGEEETDAGTGKENR